MFKKINSLNLTISLFVLSFFVSSPALAGTFENILKGFSKTGQTAGYPTSDSGVPTNKFEVAWVNYLNGMLTLMGLLFMINIIYAGYLWFMAHGKDEQVNRAKTMLINTTIGLSVIIAARLIVELVLTYLGQTLVTN